MSERAEDVARWLPAARAGSREALGQALGDCQAYLLLIACQELAPELQAKAGASDLVQETLLEACRDFEHFQGNTEDELMAWLRQMLLNNLSDFTRRYRGTAKRRAACESTPEDIRSSADPMAQLSADGSSPSERAIAHELAEAVERALDRLPADYRQVILYRYQKGLSFEVIGRLMERSANAVEKLWLRAVERLREELRIAP